MRSQTAVPHRPCILLAVSPTTANGRPSSTARSGCSRRWCANTSRRASRSPRRCWCTAAGLGVSSATVRNILARLEEEGYVQQPHTSAGRIPTDRGYRFYVDLLLESQAADTGRPGGRSAAAARAGERRCSTRCCRRCRTCCRRRRGTSASRIGPAHEAAVFDRVEFVPLAAARACWSSSSRSGGHVIQKVIDVGETARRRRTAPGGQLPERGVLRPAARSARAKRCSSASPRSDRSTTRCSARAMRLATSTFSDLPDDRPIYVEGAASLLDERRA